MVRVVFFNVLKIVKNINRINKLEKQVKLDRKSQKCQAGLITDRKKMENLQNNRENDGKLKIKSCSRT